MSGYADPNADPNEGAVTAQGEYGAMQPAYGGEEYDGAVANFADGKGGKGAPFMQTEKLWLFGEKKPLSIQSYGSLPVEARASPGRAPPCPCFPPWGGATPGPRARPRLAAPPLSQPNSEDVWHEDLPATNKSFYLVYFSAFLHTYACSMFMALGIAAIRYTILRGWCSTTCDPPPPLPAAMHCRAANPAAALTRCARRRRRPQRDAVLALRPSAGEQRERELHLGPLPRLLGVQDWRHPPSPAVHAGH